MNEALDVICSIQAGRLVQIGRNRLNTAQEDKHVEADELPGAQRCDTQQGLVGALQERLRGKADTQQYRIEQAGFRIQELPDGCHDHERGNHRQEVGGAKEPETTHTVFDQEREGEAENHLSSHADNGVEP